MLVLTRKHQEKIRIGDEIVITVLRTKGKAVRLGIEAPTNVPVIRGELAFQNAPANTNDAGADGPPNREEQSTGSGRSNPPRPVRTTSAWSPESAPRAERPAREPESKITLQRVPRRKVADVLPRLTATSPIRTMLNERSASL